MAAAATGFAAGSTVDGKAVSGSALPRSSQEQRRREQSERENTSQRGQEKGFESTSKACVPPVVGLKKAQTTVDRND